MRLSVATLLASAVALTIVITTEVYSQAQTRPNTRGGGRGPATQPLFSPDDPANVEKLTKLGKRDRRVHDPSTLVKCNGQYYFFWTGRGVMGARSKDLTHWEDIKPIFQSPPPWQAEAVPANRGTGYWAPDVIHVGDRYLVYYSISTFGKNTSAIGCTSNPTLDPDDPAYKWTDEGLVIQSKQNDNFNTIDPSVTLTPEGELWMCFGSFWSGIKLIQLDPKTGKRIAPDSPIHSIAYTREIEAPFIYHHDGNYYLFVSWGICCRGVNSTYNIRVGRSKTITGPYLDKNGKDLAKEGGTLVVGSDGPFIGPGHPGILKEGDKYLFSMHFYDGTDRRGAGTLAIRTISWDSDGWPVVE
jgi:arabinan endo-1,5-alpha-L-arabinosidase